MELTITPELESIIQREVESGRYETPQQVLENAVYRLNQDDDKLGLTAAEFQSLLDEGWEAAERGDLVTPEEARAHLAKVRSELDRG